MRPFPPGRAGRGRRGRVEVEKVRWSVGSDTEFRLQGPHDPLGASEVVPVGDRAAVASDPRGADVEVPQIVPGGGEVLEPHPRGPRDGDGAGHVVWNRRAVRPEAQDGAGTDDAKLRPEGSQGIEARSDLVRVPTG